MKIALVLLALAAPLSLSYLLSATRQTADILNAVSPLPPVGTFSLLDDKDGDGLSNRDENLWRTDWENPDSDGDGFKDGEEVISGHDPHKKGPDDFMDRSKNLTEHAGSLLLGGYIVGDLREGSTEYDEAVNRIVDDIFAEYRLQSATLADHLDLVPTNMETVAAYASATADAMEYLFLPSGKDVNEAVTAWSSDLAGPADLRYRASLIDKRADAFAKVPVPTAFLSHHRYGLALLRGLARQLVLLADSEDDPIRISISTAALSSLATDGMERFTNNFVSAVDAAVSQLTSPASSQ